MKYSPSTGGFYLPEIHKDIPPDTIDLSEEEYVALYAELSSGKSIKVTGDKVEAEDVPQKSNRANEIHVLLAQIDLDSIRPLREGDKVRLAKLDAQAKALVEELGKIKDDRS